jgi:hypothetical protein
MQLFRVQLIKMQPDSAEKTGSACDLFAFSAEIRSHDRF